MSKNNKKQSILQKELSTKEVLLVVGVCSIVFCYGYLFIYPKYQELKSSKSRLESANTELVDYQSKVNNMPKLQDELESIKSRVEIKSKIIKHNMEDGMFLIGLDNKMKDESVEMISLKIDESTDYEEFHAIPMDMEFRGDYRSIRKVITYLQNQKNTTQILDYDIETYIEEVSQETTENESSTTDIVVDEIVYWSDEVSSYHKKDCVILQGRDTVIEGNPIDSNKEPCDVCKPYNINNTTIEQDIVEEEPIAEGDVTASIKFIVYTSQDSSIELENGNPESWEPGKYNPFDSTTK